jgi:hypothetical protein
MLDMREGEITKIKKRVKKPEEGKKIKNERKKVIKKIIMGNEMTE